MSEIINRVAQSSLVSLNLEEFYPKEERVLFDLQDFLFQGLVLREKDFRQSLKEYDWEKYRGKWVAIYCSVDAIIPTWAYMLVATYLQPVVLGFVVGDLESLEQLIVDRVVDSLEQENFKDRPVVVKGCSSVEIPFYAYGKLVEKLQPVVKSLMFGEPCSTVPLFKKPKN
ncbi:DUF2480 family protein [Algoriphagus kandeliae]|uniref:DUF2480 family protein n=1 Tax=Algoriphagus kandeliae TaxID=2562278 RepID=A0A4Y9QN30_9BACT|nr:DUF2480 family protein [Algoriphagus kandeliae]TFV92205.1 DUF2480 family protein [Algoriphagus kandeliae]